MPILVWFLTGMILLAVIRPPTMWDSKTNMLAALFVYGFLWPLYFILKIEGWWKRRTKERQCKKK